MKSLRITKKSGFFFCDTFTVEISVEMSTVSTSTSSLSTLCRCRQHLSTPCRCRQHLSTALVDSPCRRFVDALSAPVGTLSTSTALGDSPCRLFVDVNSTCRQPLSTLCQHQSAPCRRRQYIHEKFNF